MRTIYAAMAALALAASSCGEPALNDPQALQVVFLPLHFARDVAPGVVPRAYFSAAVDAGSLTDQSVFMRSSPWSCSDEQDASTCHCGEQWSVVEGQAAPAAGDPAVVEFIPTNNTAFQTCYLLVFTTAVRGTERGPLESLGLPAEILAGYGLDGSLDVGALEDFWTAAD